MIHRKFTEKGDCCSEFLYIPNILSLDEIKIYKGILSDIDFEVNYNYHGSKIIRKQKWFHQDKAYFCSKWIKRYRRWEGNVYFSELEELQKLVMERVHDKLGEDLTIPEINSCLVQHYENGSNYIRDHRDTDKSFGKEPVILGLSLGSSRTLSFKRVKYNGSNSNLSKRDKERGHLNFSFKLDEGSVFIMAGSSQKYWTHGMPKEPTMDERYSLTFRKTI